MTNSSLSTRELVSGTVLSNRLQDFTFGGTGSGVRSLQFAALNLDGSEELIFDRFRIGGDRIHEPSTRLHLLAGLSVGLPKRRH